MLLGVEQNFCGDTSNIWQLLGLVVYIIKIVIPLALIILGMIDLGKAVISSDEKAINKSVGTLIKRFIAAVVVFFIPTIVNAAFGLIGVITDSTKNDYQKCVDCITNPYGKCEGYIKDAKANLLGESDDESNESNESND